MVIDPVESKRERAMEFGATHTFASAEEATGALVDLTLGALGRVGWRLGAPVVRAGFVASLRRMADRCAREYRARDAS